MHTPAEPHPDAAAELVVPPPNAELLAAIGREVARTAPVGWHSLKAVVAAGDGWSQIRYFCDFGDGVYRRFIDTIEAEMLIHNWIAPLWCEMQESGQEWSAAEFTLERGCPLQASFAAEAETVPKQPPALKLKTPYTTVASNPASWQRLLNCIHNNSVALVPQPLGDTSSDARWAMDFAASKAGYGVLRFELLAEGDSTHAPTRQNLTLAIGRAGFGASGLLRMMKKECANRSIDKFLWQPYKHDTAELWARAEGAAPGEWRSWRVPRLDATKGMDWPGFLVESRPDARPASLRVLTQRSFFTRFPTDY